MTQEAADRSLEQFVPFQCLGLRSQIPELVLSQKTLGRAQISFMGAVWSRGEGVVREAFICISALTRIPKHAHADTHACAHTGKHGFLVPSPAPFLRPSAQERAPLAGPPTRAGSASALMLQCQGARMPTHHPGRRLSADCASPGNHWQRL